MNYYIQGNKENADKIKAAFESNGYNTMGWRYNSDKGIYFTHEFDDVVDYTSNCIFADIIKTHPDYKELELPKPHYDIKNFKPFDKVLTRNYDTDTWDAGLFSHYIDDEDGKAFVTTFTYRNQCIPFDGNEHLLGTTDPCDEQYINW